jgi:Sperm-tail PG-rich repeat
MAFVNRAERKLFIFSNHSTIGPGAYIGLNKYKTSTSYAPFSSSTERNFEKQNSVYTPGPGSYSDIFFKQKSTKNISPAFASQKTRFEKKIEEIPGPGSYNVSPHWSEKKMSIRTVNATNWIRLPSAPSIPGPGQGYGYDETPAGELVIHKGPDVIAGTSNNSVGPGHYNPKYMAPARGLIWHKNAEKRSAFIIKSAIPGPGAYAPKLFLPKYKEKPSPAFISNSKRGTQIKTEEDWDDGVPGPGKYSIKSTFTPPPVRQPQNFGSNAERFKSTSPDLINLGPGHYDLSPSNLKKNPQEFKAPFCSTNLRFQNTPDLNPGPGSYRNIDVQKKVWGKQGVFGCTEKRFNDIAKEDIPGPGSYALDRSVGLHNSAKHKGHSVFLSKCERISYASSNNSPAPGTYHIPSPIGHLKPPPVPLHPILVREDQENKSVGFNAQADRFFYNKEDPGPGPGAYKVKEKSRLKTVIVSKESRFKNIREKTPGPGYYNEQEPWKKKTFNLLFE